METTSTTSTTSNTGGSARRYARAQAVVAKTTFDLDAQRFVWLYARISKSRANETSIETQVANMTAEAEARGWTIVGTSYETGQSAFKGKAPRAEFKKAVDAIVKGTANTLMVNKLDRFMRGTIPSVILNQRLLDAGGSVYSVKDKLDTANPRDLDRFMDISRFAEQESQVKSERTTDWHDGRFRHHLPSAGRRLFGYDKAFMDGVHPTSGLPTQIHTLTINEDEATVVRMMARMVLEGESLTAVMNAATAQSNRKWSLSGVKYVLISETIAGLRFHKNAINEGNWEPILEREQWEAVCAILTNPNRRTAFHNTSTNLLTGLLTCELCGHMLIARTGLNRSRYVCSGGHREGNGCFNGVNRGYTDAAIEALIFAKLDNTAWQAMKSQGRGYDPAVIAAYQAKLAVITESYLSPTSKMTAETYQSSCDMVNAAIAQAEASEAIQLPDIEDVRSAWPALDINGKRLIVSAVFESIVIRKADQKSGVMQLARIVATPKRKV